MRYFCKLGIVSLCLTAVTPVLAQKVINFAVPSPPRAAIVQKFFIPWSQKVSADSDGTIKVEAKTGRTLASPFNVYDRVKADVAQIGWGMQMFMRRFPRSTVALLPFEANTAEEATVALWRLYEKGVTTMEYAEVKLLALIVMPPTSIHMKNKPIKSLSALKGMKIAAATRTQAGVVSRLGAAPISLPLPAMYQGLNRGMIDGVIMVWTAFMPFKLFEVTKHHYDVPFGATTGMVFMTKKSYASLPEAGRRAIDANSGLKLSQKFGKFMDRLNRGSRSAIQRMPGHTFVKMPAAEVANWRLNMRGVVEKWKKETVDGATVLKAFRAELASIRSKQ
ncbi:TRAP transporter substrate-binding protein [Alphaproteobacteria bacterium]|nr:TRAP transporter substrate-binding protein [Alphaproteobacteria bacterium]